MLSILGRLALVSLAVALPSNGGFLTLQADPGLFWRLKFDYIIIGGGTAGLTVAARLSEHSNLTIGVIEGGLYHQQDPAMDTPARFLQSSGPGSDLDWGFLTVPQPAANNGSILLSSGKMVGGSSGLNYLAWTRASAVEYDAWETLGNGPTWNWKSMLPYFKKVESYTGPPPEGIFPNASASTAADVAAFHGKTGPVKVSFNDIYGSITTPLVKAMNALGIRTNSDSSNGNTTGISNLAASVDRQAGIRSYGPNTYFTLIANRPNVHVLTGTYGSKVIFSNSSQTDKLEATGVQYLYDRHTFIANASKEIIISAGSMQTPKVLELSGIGNKAILNGLGIETLLDLPQVGENLQDHPIVPRDFALQKGLIGIDSLRNNLTFSLEQTKKYETTRNGIFASSAPAAAFIPFSDLVSGQLNETIDAMHKGLLAELGDATISPLYSAQLKIQLEWLMRKDMAHVELFLYDGKGLAFTLPAPDTAYLSMYLAVMHPFSRGSVHLGTTDPLEPPLVDPNYLHLSIDADMFSFMGNFTDRLVTTQPLAAAVVHPSTPPAGADFLNYTRGSLQSFEQPIGTAALAPRELGGVVDPTLMVYGTTNVRVVDASVIPLHIASHLQATVYAIAEKGADIILAALSNK